MAQYNAYLTLRITVTARSRADADEKAKAIADAIEAAAPDSVAHDDLTDAERL